MSHNYDLAFSFAGEQRDYVEAVVRACQARSLEVFYDRDKNNEWWGGNFIRSQRNIYSSESRFFVPFLSSEYLSKPVPIDEFSSAMMTAVNQGDGYILPVLMPKTVVPADLLHPHIHYLRAEDYTPDQLADELSKKVASAKRSGQEPVEIGPAVERVLNLRMPKMVPLDWSKYRELDNAFEFIAQRFQEGASKLEEQRLICTVKVRDNKISARVERGGETVAGIDIRRGGFLGDDHLSWQVGTRNFSDSTSNGWATPEFDKEHGVGFFKVSDLNLMAGSKPNPQVDTGGLFEHLWGLLIDQIER